MERDSIARMGISRIARAGSRYSASVASSAAIVSLSTRNARNSGFSRNRLTTAPDPTMIPA